MSINRSLPSVLGVVAMVTVGGAGAFSTERATSTTQGHLTEQYQRLPLPPGFQVLVGELDGPVYANASGKTLYTWPFKALRAGESGDQLGKPTCSFQKRTDSDGILEPYPGGFVLPDLDKRRSCAEEWPPEFADDQAKPVGAWSIVVRPEGRKQWAYQGYPVYSSIADKKPGDVLGSTKRGGDGRVPIAPPPLIPPTFSVIQAVNGRLLATSKGITVYASDADRPGKSNCDAQCQQQWKPILAPLFAEAQGEWSIFERTPGIKQWAYRGHPLYTYVQDGESDVGSLVGNDVPGWHSVYTQHVAAPPNDFMFQDTPAGQVIADRRGHTIYIYNCTEDTIDQFACNLPDSPQQYKFAVCGGGDPDTCNRLFPYVRVSSNAKNESSLWQPLFIDPHTGHEVSASDKGAIQVWAYRGSPVYTYSDDREPGAINGHGWGEGSGHRNGFTAFFVRNDFSRSGP